MYKHDFLSNINLVTAAGTVKFDKKGLAKVDSEEIKAELDKLPDVKEIQVEGEKEKEPTKEEKKVDPKPKETKTAKEIKKPKATTVKKSVKKATTK